jgi:hypothetical protein
MFLAVALIVLSAALPVAAQSRGLGTAPNAGVRVEISASYDVNGATENQASIFGVRVPLTNRWAGQFRTVLAPAAGSSGVQFNLAEAVYTRSLADVFRKASSAQFNPQRVEVFAYGGAGTARNAITADNASFAFSVGGGINLKLNDNTSVTLVEYNYIRSRVLQAGVVLSSHHQIAPGLKIRF